MRFEEVAIGFVSLGGDIASIQRRPDPTRGLVNVIAVSELAIHRPLFELRKRIEQLFPSQGP